MALLFVPPAKGGGMEINMKEKKKIPCRVCGKLFEPCSYCQSHADIFRWRNFACSIGCATKYISDATAYRESLKYKENTKSNSSEIGEIPSETCHKKRATTKKKYNKSTSAEIVENNETE